MSEFTHPPITLGTDAHLSLERQFAEEVYVLLADGSVDLQDTVGDCNVTMQVTDRADMVAEDATRKVAMRIRGIPVLSIMGGDVVQLTPSADYRVLTLEYGESNDERADLEDDEAFDWRPYVLAVISNEDFGDVSILNPETGKQLEPMDMLAAHAYLTQVRQTMRGERFEEQMCDDAIVTTYNDPRTTTYGQFDTTDFLCVSECDTCETNNQACDHNPFTLN